MTVNEAINRGNNILMTVLLAMAGFSGILTVFGEDQWLHRLDDIVLFAVGVGVLIWYFWGSNKYSRSVVPLVLFVVAAAFKALALLLEAGDQADLGDDPATLIGLGIFFVLSAVIYFRSPSVRERRGEGPAA